MEKEQKTEEETGKRVPAPEFFSLVQTQLIRAVSTAVARRGCLPARISYKNGRVFALLCLLPDGVQVAQ